jgi:LPS export ABC transporter protein LptC
MMKEFKSAASFIIFILSIALFSCETNEEVLKVETYEGPLLEVDGVTTLWSDSAVVRIKLLADKQFEFENGDRQFPEGIYIEFYNAEGEKTSTLKADRGFYTKTENIYKAEGDVQVISYENNEKLNTEELYWKPDDKKIYTDKFVRIETDDQLMMGEGLTANQDFSYYRILKPYDGYFSLDND